MMLRVFLCAALLGPAEPPSEYQLGADAFTRGDYEAAAHHFERAYANGEAPDMLYEWAQAARRGGDCPAAAELYQRFLDETGETTPDPAMLPPDTWQRMRTNATEQRDKCREESPPPPAIPTPVATDSASSEDATSDDPDAGADTEVADPTVADSGDSEVAADPITPVPAPVEPTRRRPDALGVTLVTVGAVTAAVGAGLLVAAPLERRAAEDQFVHDDHNRQIDRAVAEQRAGFVLAPVGLALVVGGVIRFAVVGRRRRADRRASAWIAPSPGGAVVHGRF